MEDVLKMESARHLRGNLVAMAIYLNTIFTYSLHVDAIFSVYLCCVINVVNTFIYLCFILEWHSCRLLTVGGRYIWNKCSGQDIYKLDKIWSSVRELIFG